MSPTLTARIRKRKWWLVITGLLLIIFLANPPKLFSDINYALVVNDRDGHLIGAKIATDGQWRFPPSASVPEKFIKAITYFEDEYFDYHPGVNPIATLRALKQNFEAGRIVSGGSTLTMQTIRLSRRKQRTIPEKLIEMVLAVRLELSYAKKEIMAYYANHAPFGGNVVGLGAAAWRYYGLTPEQLSWAEMATLAVLPNQPSLIFPGRNQELLKEKRNRLLHKLWLHQELDSLSYALAISEPLPQKPKPLPDIARHLVEQLDQTKSLESRSVNTSIDRRLQIDADRILNRYHDTYRMNHINNGAVMVVDMQNSEVLAYIGNTRTTNRYSKSVDIIRASRSTGSLLKPLLYATAIDDGIILPQSLLIDIPTFIGGFAPKNFNKDYDGAVPADDALVRSLNIPFVHLLKDYTYQKFHSKLNSIGFTTLKSSASHYGLSLILGGAECSLWELSQAYAQFGQQAFRKGEPNEISVIKNQVKPRESSYPISSEAAWITSTKLIEVNSPGDNVSWKRFDQAQPISWKTGTSFGFKDAWAIGYTSKYLVGVWIGNASGEGRPEVTGSKKAAPIMFEVFEILPKTTRINQPLHVKLSPFEVCTKSGFKKSRYCSEHKTVYLPTAANQSVLCSNHKLIYTNTDGKRIDRSCAQNKEPIPKQWFVLSPAQAYYFKRHNRYYQPIPDWSASCKRHLENLQPMSLIYPKKNAQVFIPKELDGRQGNVVFHLAHRLKNKKVFWHIDDVYMGATTGEHKLSFFTNQGEHQLSLIDEDGYELRRRFFVTSQ